MELNGPFLVIQIPFSFLRSPLSRGCTSYRASRELAGS